MRIVIESATVNATIKRVATAVGCQFLTLRVEDDPEGGPPSLWVAGQTENSFLHLRVKTKLPLKVKGERIPFTIDKDAFPKILSGRGDLLLYVTQAESHEEGGSLKFKSAKTQASRSDYGGTYTCDPSPEHLLPIPAGEPSVIFEDGETEFLTTIDQYGLRDHFQAKKYDLPLHFNIEDNILQIFCGDSFHMVLGVRHLESQTDTSFQISPHTLKILASLSTYTNFLELTLNPEAIYACGDSFRYLAPALQEAPEGAIEPETGINLISHLPETPYWVEVQKDKLLGIIKNFGSVSDTKTPISLAVSSSKMRVSMANNRGVVGETIQVLTSSDIGDIEGEYLVHSGIFTEIISKADGVSLPILLCLHEDEDSGKITSAAIHTGGDEEGDTSATYLCELVASDA